MQFRKFLEAKLEPNILRPYKIATSTDKKYTSNSHSLKIDKNGNVVKLNSEDYNTSAPHFEINPGVKQITLYRISPQSLDFHKIITALQSKYNDVMDWRVEQILMAGHMMRSGKEHYRTVGYWMKQGPVSILNKMPKYFYHGTSTNQWYDDIKKKGLLPRSLSGSTGSYGSQNIGSLSQHNIVYLSTHPDFATRSAAIQAAEKHGGQPLILKIDSSGLFPERFTVDEDMRVKIPQESIKKGSVLAYQGKVPPTIIEPFLLGTRKEESNTRHFDWERFKDVKIGEHPMLARLKDNHAPYHDSPEYLALKDAGVIVKTRGTSETGHSYETNVITNKDLTDAELKSILKKATWVSNARHIIKDLDDMSHSVLNSFAYHLSYVNKSLSPEDQKIIDMLLESKILAFYKHEERKIYEITKYDYENKAITLAKLMGKMDFTKLVEKLKHITGTKSSEGNDIYYK